MTHVVLAASIVPLALVTASRGLRTASTAHVRIARWTLPIWLYVSVTGVVIYLMLYQVITWSLGPGRLAAWLPVRSAPCQSSGSPAACRLRLLALTAPASRAERAGRRAPCAT